MREILQPVLNVLLCIGWNPYLAVRVGEATNPGPRAGGSGRTVRVRNERAHDAPELSVEMMQQIANMVIQALQGQLGGLHAAHPANPPEDEDYHTRYSSPEVEDAGWYEAHSSHEVGWANYDSWYSALDCEWDASAYDPDTGWWDPAAWEQWKYWKKQRRKKWHAQSSDEGVNELEQSDWPLLQSTTPVSPQGPKVKKRKVIGPSTGLVKPQQHGSRFAAKIVPAEWNCDPRLTTPNQIQHALEDGKGLPGNLVISRSDDTLEVLQNLIAAFDVHDALTLAEVAPAASSEPACAVWWHGASSPDSKPQRLKLRCSQLTVVSGPEPRPPTTVTFRPKPKVEMSTLRVLAPTQYRQLFIDADTWDSPTTIIAELAKKLGKPATTFTGGNMAECYHY